MWAFGITWHLSFVSINQKQELPVVAMFVKRLGRNEQSS
jgi:hypothetical protein